MSTEGNTATTTTTPTIRMYWWALGVALLGLALATWPFLSEQAGSVLGLYVAGASMPVALLLAVSARLERRPSTIAAIGGAGIGVVVALLGHGLVAAVAWFALAGLADAAVDLLEVLRVDPTLTGVAGSPWTLVLLIDLVVVAPLTEEVGKAVGGALSGPTDRRTAFLAGVAAGTGFAIVENIVYATIYFYGIGEQVVLMRMLGVAVHPLASGLIVLGWWEFQQHRDLDLLTRRFVAGAAVHALWNGSIVVLIVASEAYRLDATEVFGAVPLAYSAALGAATAAAIWWLASRLAQVGRVATTLRLTDARAIAAWTLVGASAIVPVAILLLAYPETL
jgi:RsiW-degrading membrane proteinase PrsW (M82 family)